MARMDRIGQHATTVWVDEYGATNVMYHATTVIRWTETDIVLNSGGWQTVTTKARINQASNQYRLALRVWQKDFAWYVDCPDGQTRPFVDGMVIRRGTLQGVA